MNYNALAQEHFFHPKNSGAFGADAVQVLTAKVGHLGVSDVIQLQIQLDESRHVQAARFKAYGNPYTIAGLSWLTQQFIGQPIEQLAHFNYKMLIDTLEIPQTKISSALLIEDAVKRCLMNGQKTTF